MQPFSIHYLQHVPFEGLGHITHWAQARGFKLTSTRLYAGESMPSTDAFDMLIVMGGPMGVYDEAIYPWMGAEKKFIRAAIEDGKKVLGICLGAQLIAEVLGARVYANNEKEIGWFDVVVNADGAATDLLSGFPRQFTTFHWHGDTFDLPQGAIGLMSSQACKNQAYLYMQNVLGLQFHFETTSESLQEMIANCGDELHQANYIQTEEEIRDNQSHIALNHQLLEQLLDRFIKKALV